MEIRRATLDDAEALSALNAAAFSAKFGSLYPPAVLEDFLATAYAPGAIAGLIAQPERETWLAVEGGRLAGFAMLSPAELPHPEVAAGAIELCRLYTAPEATGRGIGGRLMDAVVLPAFGAATGDAWVGVYSGNEGALRFYARYGFESVGEYAFLVGPMRDREFILRRRRPV